MTASLARATVLSKLTIALLGLASAVPLIVAQERSADAHIHGKGTLQLIQAGNDVMMSLNVSAADVLGFERAPHDDADRAAIAMAAAKLEDPLVLFQLNGTCTVVSVALEGLVDNAHDVEDEPGHEHEEGHSDIGASYALRCDQPIQSLTTTFFATFAGTETLRVEAILDGRPAVGEVTGDNSVLDLTQ